MSVYGGLTLPLQKCAVDDRQDLSRELLGRMRDGDEAGVVPKHAGALKECVLFRLVLGAAHLPNSLS